MSDKKDIIKKEENPKHSSEKQKDADEIKESIMPKKIAEMFSMTMQSGGFPQQILDKITDKHIDKVLDITEKTNSYIHEDNKFVRRYALAYAIVAALLLGFLVLILRDKNKDLLIQILTVLTSIIGGFGAGYGYCKYKTH